MKKILFICSVLALSSCATLFSGTRAKVTVDSSEPVYAPITLNVDDETYHNVRFPMEVKVKRGFAPSEIEATASGYTTGTATIDKTFNAVSLGNIVLGGIPGYAVDLVTGAVTKPEKNEYVLYMKEGNYVEQRVENPAPTYAVAREQEVVTRETQGSTSLEKTVIRWYFESEPQGARIFWRVISSIPDQVRNTNELWLGNTPFEETRSFNIQGLTYENSNDVQIEIKVRRSGYMDQTKRFNVRQALDQQEISSFFDMVKAEE